MKFLIEYIIIKKSGLFDERYYLRTYDDVRKADINPIKHFIKYGWKEGRNPSEKFETNFYLNSYPDVKNAGINPLVHFILYGSKEGRITHRKNSIVVQYKISKKGNLIALARYVKNNSYIIKKTIKEVKLNGLKYTINKVKSKLYGSSGPFATKKYEYVEPKLTSCIKNEIEKFPKKPLISIIMPVYNVDPKWLDLAIKSVEEQWYDNWELCIADDNSTNKKTIEYLKTIKNPKIKIRFLNKNLNISGASNAALELAKGEYIAIMDHDDELTSNALYEIVKVINETGAEFIYSDEDKIEMNGTFSEPHFKPDFSPDMLLSQNYISHLCVIKKELIDKVKGWGIGVEGSQDYDLYLKVLEHTDKVFHIPKVLYHWRKIPGSTAAQFSEKAYAWEAGKKALESALRRRNIKATVKKGKYPGTYKIEYELKNQPLISIIIPFKDKPELLERCIESILIKTTYKNFEIIGISNDSKEQETFEMMKFLQKKDTRVKFYEYNIPFNYSKINNYAVKNYVNGDHIVLMNNDIEILTPNWIEEMLMFSQREDVGVVGAKLYYPNDTIQHCGVIIGIGGVAGHSHKYIKKDEIGYFVRPHIVQNLSAVTAALMMVKTSTYKELNGFNENELKIAFNDVDFCLRAREKGYLIVYTPWVEAYHHESISRGLEDNPEKIARFNKEIEYMKKRHHKILTYGDPYYNPNLTLDRENFELR